MHEMSLAQGIIDLVRESAVEKGIEQIKRIKLVIGKLSMAEPESLRFAFKIMATDNLFKGAILDIEEKEITCRCNNCQAIYAVQDVIERRCPRCRAIEAELVSGHELYVDWYEGE